MIARGPRVIVARGPRVIVIDRRPDRPHGRPSKGDHEISQQSDGPGGRADGDGGGTDGGRTGPGAPLRAGVGGAHGGAHGAARTAVAAPGPETLDDPVFPSLGNKGYRVSSYALDFAYDAATRKADATATLRSVPTAR